MKIPLEGFVLLVLRTYKISVKQTVSIVLKTAHNLLKPSYPLDGLCKY